MASKDLPLEHRLLNWPLAIRRIKSQNLAGGNRFSTLKRSPDTILLDIQEFLDGIFSADRVPQTQPIVRVRSAVDPQVAGKLSHTSVHLRSLLRRLRVGIVVNVSSVPGRTCYMIRVNASLLCCFAAACHFFLRIPDKQKAI